MESSLPRIQFTQRFIDQCICPSTKKKIDFFDVEIPGLCLEVRISGGKTYYIKYKNTEGSQKQIKIGNARIITVLDARQKAKKLLAKAHLGVELFEKIIPEEKTQTFESFVYDNYIPYIQKYKRSIIAELSYLKRHLIPYFGKVPINKITERSIADFHLGQKEKGYAPGTCNRGLTLLKHILNMALKWDLSGLKSNPSSGVMHFKNPATKERYLTHGETLRLYEAVVKSENLHLKYIIPLLILTGARKRELLDAKWEDISLLERRWRIPITKNGKPRHVPLSESSVTLIKSIPVNAGSPWLFANPDTMKPYVKIQKSWETARKHAGLEDVRLHDLRHSFASFLVNSGRTLYEVQKILGHADSKTTQRYAHLSQKTLIDAVNDADKAIGFDFQSSSHQQQNMK